MNTFKQAQLAYDAMEPPEPVPVYWKGEKKFTFVEYDAFQNEITLIDEEGQELIIPFSDLEEYEKD